jgi:flagellar basal-body rod protein FlgB
MLQNKVRVIAVARAMAAHAAARQSQIAQNVAHADTPGYRPRDLPPFAKVMQEILRAESASSTGMRNAGPHRVRLDPVEVPGMASPNGNAVSLEAEMMRAAEVRSAHDMALAIQGKLSGVVRTALGRGR